MLWKTLIKSSLLLISLIIININIEIIGLRMSSLVCSQITESTLQQQLLEKYTLPHKLIDVDNVKKDKKKFLMQNFSEFFILIRQKNIGLINNNKNNSINNKNVTKNILNTIKTNATRYCKSYDKYHYNNKNNHNMKKTKNNNNHYVGFRSENILTLIGSHLHQSQLSENKNQSENVKKNENEKEIEKVSTSKYSKQRVRRSLSDIFIAPNTRWCGRGNIANNTYNHLGGASAADKCCRKHDHCNSFIPALSNRYDLFNYRPYTLSHCRCDQRFRSCLKMVDDDVANTVGQFFFNVLRSQCFVFRREHICRSRSADGNCISRYVKRRAYILKNRRY